LASKKREKWKSDESGSLAYGHNCHRLSPPRAAQLLLCLTANLAKKGGLMLSKRLTHLLAVGVTVLFLGATSLHAQTPPPPPPDSDGDGLADDVDECPTSDFSPTVVINGVDTGIPNTDINPAGCTFADLIDEMIDTCVASAKNHGQFVSCVSHETNILKRAKTITGRQKGKIQSIVARLHLP